MRRLTRNTKLLAVAVSLAIPFVSVVVGAVPVSARTLGTQVSSSQALAQVDAQTDSTPTSLPEDYQEPGHSITRPNSGQAPQDAGDPGGWLQSSLFFIICGAVFVMAGIVWYQSHRARGRRKAAGQDPVDIAKSTGVGVRAPSPLDK